MKKQKYLIGVDISKLTLDVALLDQSNPKEFKFKKVSNDNKGLSQIIKWLQSLKVDVSECLFCCENTGIYTNPLSLFMSDHKLTYWIINAIEIKRSKGLVRGKSDKADARDIAHYALTHQHKYAPSTLPDKTIQKLKLLFSERSKVLKSLHLFSSTRENEGFMHKEVLMEIKKSNQKIILELEKILSALEERINELIEGSKELNEQYKLLQTVPGIGKKTALYLLITTQGFTTFDNWRKMACYAGVAPFEHTSGTSIKGRTKVSHLADKKMKSMLQMCALSSLSSDTELKEYFKKKKLEGKNGMLIMNNLRCKILARAFAVINRGTPYVKMKNYIA